MSPSGEHRRVLNKTLPVLVVDDSPTACKIIAKIFQTVGFTETECCHDGADVLPKLRGRKYGLLVTDLEMAPVSGLDLIKRVRSEASLNSLPIVLTTGNLQWIKQMISRYERSGAEVHILKPFTPDDLARKLDEAFPPRS
jgi:two-component system chemotaxis response regulator CheY